MRYRNWLFSDPVPVWLWNPQAVAGVHVVLITDARGAHRPIYFGRTEDFAGRGIVSAHPAFRSWVREAGSELLLWIAVHQESNAAQRLIKQSALIQAYSPACNVQVAKLAPPITA
jgi:hypothetical protein